MIYFIQTAHENATNRRCTKNTKNTWKLLLTFLCVNRFIFGSAAFCFYFYFCFYFCCCFCCFYYGSFNCWGPLRLLKCFYLIFCVCGSSSGPPPKKKKNMKSFLSFASCFKKKNVFLFGFLRHFGNNKRWSAAGAQINKSSIELVHWVRFDNPAMRAWQEGGGGGYMSV